MTVTQVMALAHYMGEQAAKLNDASSGDKADGVDAANERARQRLVVKHGLSAERIFDATKATSSELKRQFGSGMYK